MFESPATARPIVSLEPWSVEYGPALGFEEDGADESPFIVDPFVETQDWRTGILPRPLALPEPVVFVDGVQRVDYWARVDDGESLAEAAFASVAVGAVVSRPGGASITCDYTSRVFAVTGTSAAETQVVPAGRNHLAYGVTRATETGPNAVSQAIAVVRRDLEHLCVQRMLEKHPLVIADGRLEQPGHPTNQLAGIAKTLHQLYAQGDCRRLIARLGAGERTPLFLIEDAGGRSPARYSWFLRLPYTRRIHHGYAGVVRLEVPASGGRAPIDLADMLTHNLPRFASKPEHDPRAPQNLLPVGALEKRLRHELGDARYIRRLIEDYVANGASS